MHAKTSAAAFGGAIATILVWIVTTIFPHVTVPPEVAAAFATIASAAASHWGGNGNDTPAQS